MSAPVREPPKNPETPVFSRTPPFDPGIYRLATAGNARESPEKPGNAGVFLSSVVLQAW